MSDKKDNLIEIIRLAYLMGGSDKEDDNFQWCDQGSKERAEELMEEFINDGVTV